MAETPTQKTDEPQKPAEAKAAAPQAEKAQPDQSVLGKPVVGWKTFTTKAVAALGFIGAGASVAIGAATMIMGRKAESSFVQMATKWGGGTAIIGGLLEGAVSKAAWDSAASASRTREYLKLADQLNGKGAGQSR